MPNENWIKLYRSLLEHPRFSQNGWLNVWVVLLLNATYVERKARFAGKIITLNPGQIITDRAEIAEKAGISESLAWRLLNIMKIEQQIERQTSNKSSLITILNWSGYQRSEQQNEQQPNDSRTTDCKNEQQNEQQEIAATQTVTGNCAKAPIESEQQNEQPLRREEGKNKSTHTKAEPGFPQTEAEAVSQRPAGLDNHLDWVKDLWRRAQSRGGRDWHDVPIRDWRAHVLLAWSYEKQSREQPPNPKPAQSDYRKLTDEEILKQAL